MKYDDPLQNIDTELPSQEKTAGENASQGDGLGAVPSGTQTSQNDGTLPGSSGTQASQNGYAEEIISKKISAKFRTFFLDLKQSKNGKFLKISEKSRGGQKSTIMMDAEDIPQFIKALQEIAVQA